MKRSLGFGLLLIAVAASVSFAKPSNPFAAAALPAEQVFSVEGEVRERLEAGSYLYLRVATPDGSEHWAVTLAATAPTQPRVKLLVMGRSRHFRSRLLQREFDELWFAAVSAAK